jgi:hypothetical protein
MLKDTPLLVSADEIGFMKTWDIRSMVCIQTLHYECKSSMHQILNVNEERFIGVEYRLHWFEYEDKVLVNSNGIEIKNMFPINIDYNQENHELCVSTKSDIRVVNIMNG